MKISAGFGLIYGLYDLRDPQHEVRYVGKTVRKLETRLAQHLTEALVKRRHTHCGSWIISLGRENVGILLLDQANREDLGTLEREWIARLRPSGRLTNLTDGGDGGASSRSIATRAKISASLRGRKKSPEHAAKVGMAHRGKTVTEENRRKLREAWLRNPRTHSLETRRKIGEGNRVAWLTRADRKGSGQ